MWLGDGLVTAQWKSRAVFARKMRQQSLVDTGVYRFSRYMLRGSFKHLNGGAHDLDNHEIDLFSESRRYKCHFLSQTGTC